MVVAVAVDTAAGVGVLALDVGVPALVAEAAGKGGGTGFRFARLMPPNGTPVQPLFSGFAGPGSGVPGGGSGWPRPMG